MPLGSRNVWSPRWVSPHQSTAHRIAAIALYRALLSQCRVAPLESAERDELKHVFQWRFRSQRYQQSHRKLKVAFQAGYEALELLDASSAGDIASTTRIQAVLARVPTPLKASLPPARAYDPSILKAMKNTGCLPLGQKEVEVRPRPQVSGKRTVPYLVSANKIPFLRFKKPQPANVSRMIRQKNEHWQKMIDRKEDIVENWQPIHRLEDQWDSILEEEVDHLRRLGGKDREEWEPAWIRSMRPAIEEVHDALQAFNEKSREMSKRMTEIVLHERALKEKEDAKAAEKRRELGSTRDK